MSVFQSMPNIINGIPIIASRQTVFDYGYAEPMKSSPPRTAYGQRLFDARKFAGKTQAQSAKAVGMSQGTYGELEREGKKGSSFTAQLARFFGVSAEWIATGKGSMSQSNAETEELFSAPVRSIESIRKELSSRLAEEHQKVIDHHIHMLQHEIWEIQEPMKSNGTHDTRRRPPVKK